MLSIEIRRELDFRRAANDAMAHPSLRRWAKAALLYRRVARPSIFSRMAREDVDRELVSALRRRTA